MLEPETIKHHWLRIVSIIIITFIVAFLAFYCALEMMLHRMSDPLYNAKRMEKVLKQQERNFERFEDRINENPFEPTLRPMLVNLVKENNEYKVIVDLKPLEGNEKGVNVNIKDKVITISGELEKNTHKGEEIVSFAQSYYLDEDIQTNKISKERKGDKYIITVPFD